MGRFYGVIRQPACLVIFKFCIVTIGIIYRHQRRSTDGVGNNTAISIIVKASVVKAFTHAKVNAYTKFIIDRMIDVDAGIHPFKIILYHNTLLIEVACANIEFSFFIAPFQVQLVIIDGGGSKNLVKPNSIGAASRIS